MVDFVRRAKPTTAGSGKAEVQPTDDFLRCDSIGLLKKVVG